MSEDILKEARFKLFDLTIEDIYRTKNWQWTVFYHTAIAQGIIFTVFSSLDDAKSTLLTKALFTVLSVIISGIGAYVIRESTSVLERFRERLGRILDSLRKECQEFDHLCGARIKTTHHNILFWAAIGLSAAVVCLIFAI